MVAGTVAEQRETIVSESENEKSLWQFYKPEAVPDVFYYYCSVEAFRGILTSKKLWMSNAFAMNDFQEIRWINRLIDTATEQLRNSENEAFLQRVLDQYRLNSAIAPYLCCFSSDRDVLSQWRAYSYDGTGLCIGFRAASFSIPKNLPAPNVEVAQTLGIHKVVYEPTAQNELVRATFQSALSAVNFKDNDSVETTAIACAFHLNRLALVFKNDAFSEEKEWRIIHVPLITIGKASDISVMAGVSELKFRQSKNNIVPYFELGFSSPKDGRPAIIEVVKGPKNEIPTGFLQMLLAASGFGEAAITQSRATYR